MGQDARRGESAPAYPFVAERALEAPRQWAELRSACPVAAVRLPSGDAASLLTRYDDVRTVLADSRFVRDFSSDDAASMADDESGGVFQSEMARVLGGAGHQWWRRMIARWFTARRMRAMQQDIAVMGDRLVDEMIGAGAPADLKAAYGFPLPVWVICRMLGVPESDRDRFAHWSNAMLNLTRFTRDQTATAEREYADYMRALVEQKRTAPRDDLINDLLTRADDDGRTFTAEQIVATGQALLLAGHETTANMIAKMVAMLLAERRHWQRLVDDPALIANAVEESLRFDPNPGMGVPRYTTEDVHLVGGPVRRGATALCSLGAANRDQAQFPDADVLDLDRAPNHHLSFGVGPHSCLGQSLARVELQTALEVLVRRLPGLDLDVAPDQLRAIEGLAVGGLETLPVRW